MDREGSIIKFREATIYGDDIYYVPFVDTETGRVGYEISGLGPGGEGTFFYLNPSNGVADRNIFVYEGGENDPLYDGPIHFYEVAEGWTHFADHE